MDIFGVKFSTRDIWFLGIVGVLALEWIRFHLTDATNKKNRISQAAATFRSKLLAILEGLYPSISSCNGNEYTIIKETIPKIESISADFSHFLSWYTKRRFNKAVKGYCEYCKSANRINDTARKIFDHPSSPKPENETEPLTTENFSKHVDNLLSFAKEK